MPKKKVYQRRRASHLEDEVSSAPEVLIAPLQNPPHIWEDNFPGYQPVVLSPATQWRFLNMAIEAGAYLLDIELVRPEQPTVTETIFSTSRSLSKIYSAEGLETESVWFDWVKRFREKEERWKRYEECQGAVRYQLTEYQETQLTAGELCKIYTMIAPQRIEAVHLKWRGETFSLTPVGMLAYEEDTETARQLERLLERACRFSKHRVVQ